MLHVYENACERLCVCTRVHIYIQEEIVMSSCHSNTALFPKEQSK